MNIFTIIVIIVLLIAIAYLIAYGYWHSKTFIGFGESNKPHEPHEPQKNIVHVAGVQGSGKSYLLKHLKKSRDVHYIDLDDIFIQAWKNIREDNPNYDPLLDKFTIWNTEKQKILVDIANTNSDKTIIAAGQTVSIPPEMLKEGIILTVATADELGEWYRRAIERDVHKIVDNADAIFQYVSKSPIPAIIFDLEILACGGVGVGTRIPFSTYKSWYDSILNNPTYKSYSCMSQDAAIEYLDKKYN